MPVPAPCSFRSTEECALHFWLRLHRLRHLHLRQEQGTFDPPLFRGNAKPPDFLLQLKTTGVLGLEAKCLRTRESGTRYAFPTQEIDESSGFERASGIPVWYAIPTPEGEDNSWSWIRLQKVIDEGVAEDGERMVPLDSFVRIAAEADLRKLGRYIIPRSPKPANAGPKDLASVFEGAAPVPRSLVVDDASTFTLDPDSIGFDAETQTLKVRLHHGGVREYLHVPESVFVRMMASDSRIDFFTTQIHRKYRMREHWRHAQV